MVKTKWWNTRVDEEFLATLNAVAEYHKEEHDTTASSVVREAVAFVYENPGVFDLWLSRHVEVA
jgi:hypothetical protein